MSQDPYQRLIDALDALPNGFPRTPSGTEVNLIKMVFTPEEVELAGYMGREFETVEHIAERAGMPPDRVKSLLVAMLPRAIVRNRVLNGVEKWRLGPFIIGWYERHMSRMTPEFARMFEKYMVEGGGDRILAPQPGIMRVVPVRGSLKKEYIKSFDDIDAHFQRHERFRIGDCVCRVQRNMLGSKCEMPVRRCSFSGVPPDTPLSDNVVSRETALKIFKQLEDTGHIHLASWGYPADPKAPAQYNGGCNCCADCCGILRGVTDWGLPEAPQRSNFRASLNIDVCSGCGNCIERCQMHAITEGKNGMPAFNRAKCIGCGVCVIKCPSDALELVPVSREEYWEVPASFEEWEEQRLRTLAKGVHAHEGRWVHEHRHI